MILFLRNISLFLLFSINLFAEAVYLPNTATDSTGQYVYAIWERFIGHFSITQVALSSDYGVTFTNPTITTGNGGSPNLSNDDGSANTSIISTNSTGQYVYAIWNRYNDSNYIVQVALSSNYGATWVNPTITTGDGGSPNLSDDGETAYNPYITTNSTGQYIYAIWSRKYKTTFVVQVAISSDYGVNWTNPTTTTGDGGTPNLSNNNDSGLSPCLTTDSSGQHVYALWYGYDAINESQVVKVAISSDYGVTWIDPTTATGNGGTPNLSDNDEVAKSCHIITNSTGQYVYAIWIRDQIVQTVKSSDYGVNWVKPTTTTGDGGVPNLSNNADTADFPHINTDSTGQNIYSIWCVKKRCVENELKPIVQAASSSDYGVTWINPIAEVANFTNEVGLPAGPQIDTILTKKYSYGVIFNQDNSNTVMQSANEVVLTEGIYLNVYYKMYSKYVIFQNNYVDEIYWNYVPGAVSYRVYLNNLSKLVYEGKDLEYFHQRLFLKDPKTYLVTWLDSESVESNPSQITIE